MLSPETQRLLDALLREPTDWSTIEALTERTDPALASELAQRIPEEGDRQTLHALLSVLARLPGSEADAALRTLVSAGPPELQAQLLKAMSARLTPDDAALLEPLLQHGDDALRLAAVTAAAHVRSPRLAPRLAELLSSSRTEERTQAALALGYLRSETYVGALVERLPLEQDRPFEALLAALELIGSTQAIPSLVGLLRRASEKQIGPLCHALALITGCDPFVETGTGADTSRARRAAWQALADEGPLTSPPPPRLAAVRAVDAKTVAFELTFGRGRIRLDVDPPIPGSAWMRFGQSLLVGDARVYSAGLPCGTCELFLRRMEWPARDVSATAQAMEEIDLRAGLTEAFLRAWSPLIGQLQSGRYLLRALSLPVERIDEALASLSWFNQRDLFRRSDDPDDADEEPPTEPGRWWPGTIHYQGPRSGEVPTYPVLMPLQDPATLDEARVREYEARIRSGERPVVMTLGWIDSRDVGGRYPERMLNLCILNGHHRLEAYARLSEPAPIVVLARVADSWGPPEDRSQYLREAFDQVEQVSSQRVV